ncbi:hypothetical protein A5658_20690 [Mycobacterium sp. 1245111.1]|nr:hypothetical protein A5658_20690 [Mycobacterium sp. 1245111.1]
MDHHTIRVLDVDTNVLVASTSLAEVTSTPAEHGGIPVLVLRGPGLPTLIIRPHGGAGTWRRSARTQQPNYLATDTEWLGLADRLDLASDLVDEFTPHTLGEHITAFVAEFYAENPWTWRAPLMFGVVALVVAACAPSGAPVALAIGLAFLGIALLAWRFKWRF